MVCQKCFMATTSEFTFDVCYFDQLVVFKDPRLSRVMNLIYSILNFTTSKLCFAI